MRALSVAGTPRGSSCGFCVLACGVSSRRTTRTLRGCSFGAFSTPRRAPAQLPRAEAPRPSPGLSADARFVRDVTAQLRQRGIPESSVWRLVNRERPEWTRERWDAALAELRGEVRPVAAASVLS